MGCVSLEVTQRCNLDCTLCYLSDSAEAVRDIPLQELLRRIDDIAVQYGPNTDVQISGGDPTLRDKDELSAIVRYVRARGMRASLFTNGILLTRALLERLVADGLNDVAFHVDMTQERKGYTCELDMHVLRLHYINMARGLPLSVIFNTTVYADNMHEIAAVADFFVQHSDVVRFASFQLGADTGRGTVAGRDPVVVTQASVCQAIEQGAGISLNFDALHGGHRSCNRYAMLFVVGKHRVDALADGDFVAKVMRDTADIPLERDQSLRGA
jgi:7,8-dihydro-6-hydroxymethylpterin dimethyltransferase